MSNRNLGILAAVAAVMVIWAILQSRWSRPARIEPSAPAPLIQGLDTSAIDSITVGVGDDAVKIAKKNDRFVVVNKADYPADPKQINDLISKCLDVKRTKVYTSNAKNHEDLEVTEGKARSVVKFLKADGSLLTGVVVGKSPESGQGAFVRMVGSDDVYLAESAPWFRSTPMEYLNAELLALEADDVNSVTVTTPDGSYTLRPQEGGSGTVMENLPADKTLKTSDARSVLTALTSLRFDDVNTPAAVEGLTFNHQYSCMLDNTIQYTLKLAKKDGKTYLRCEASYPDMTPVTVKKGGNESEEELKKKEAKLMAQGRVQEFTLQHKNWVYTIPAWKAGYLTKPQADLLEDKPKPAGLSDPNDQVGAPTEATLPVEQREPVDEPNQAADPNE
ncbi:MAG: DUF4340 domain-containing protein [Sedimentisphaerales bacterium]|nr:DUF4340 domain-containing protein [Sedimentisphaerales bacterium]